MFTNYEDQLINKAIKRKKLFLVISIISVIIGLTLAVFYSWQTYSQPNFDKESHFIIVILILLNARQNLRQYNYAKVLEKLIKR